MIRYHHHPAWSPRTTRSKLEKLVYLKRVLRRWIRILNRIHLTLLLMRLPSSAVIAHPAFSLIPAPNATPAPPQPQQHLGSNISSGSFSERFLPCNWSFKNNSRMAQKTTIHHLPNEILSEIARHLPVRHGRHVVDCAHVASFSLTSRRLRAVGLSHLLREVTITSVPQLQSFCLSSPPKNIARYLRYVRALDPWVLG